jgi:hypothetical protein
MNSNKTYKVMPENTMSTQELYVPQLQKFETCGDLPAAHVAEQ